MSELWFRNADSRYPFFRDDREQVAARWHGPGAGPAQYLADTPDGAWAEFLRHEEIRNEADLGGVERDLWAIETDLEAEAIRKPALDASVLRGGESSYDACQQEADRLRADGATALIAPTAALRDGGARGQTSSAGTLHSPAGARDGRTLVLFGSRPELAGWCCCRRGRPDGRMIGLVRPL